MLDVHRLRLLREVAAWGTISAAAEACSLTPSAVSQQLAVLQREAGAPLLFRDGRRVILTEAARVLVAHTEHVLAELESAEADVAALSADVGGVVQLAAFPTAAAAIAPAAIASCRTAYPGLRVVFEDREPASGIAALKAGHVDVLLVYEYNLLPEVADAGVELTPLVTESLLAAVPVDIPLPAGVLRLEALRGQPWIAPRSDTALRSTLERACGLAGFAPQLDYTSDDYTVILSLVSAGLGVTLLPQLAIEGLSTTVRLHSVTAPGLTRTVSAAVRAGSGRTPNIASLLTHLREAAIALNLSAP